MGKINLLSSLLILTLVGCSDKSAISPFVDNPPPGYPAQRSPEGPLVVLNDPDLLTHYRAFTVPAVQVTIRDSARVMPATPTEIDELGEKLRAKVIRALGDKHTIFTQPVEGFGIIKISLTNVWSDRGLLSTIPGSRLVTPLAGGATMEAKIYDSVTGKELGRVWDSRVGTPPGYFSGMTKWGSTEAVFDDWARILARKIAAAG